MAFEKHISQSAKDTHQLGFILGRSLPENAIVAFFGDLGAGKTTFIRGLVEGVGGIDLKQVCSPTFNFLNIYQGNKSMYHFDLYRLPRKEEFFVAGFDEYFYAKGISCIEWAEKIEPFLPKETLRITFSYLQDPEHRQIAINRGGK